MNTAKSPVHNQGSTPPFCPSPPPPPPKKKAKSLGKVATYESRQAATAIRSDTSGPGCLKGG